MQFKYLECDCSSTDHTIRFVKDEEDDNRIYLEVQLNNQPFFTRFIKAVKYIFGYKCSYGHWDCFLFNDETKKELINFLSGQ